MLYYTLTGKKNGPPKFQHNFLPSLNSDKSVKNYRIEMKQSSN